MIKKMLVFVLFSVFVGVPTITYATPILLEFSSTINAGAAINEGFKYVGQTFTAPTTGTLNWVSIAIQCGRDENLNEHLQIDFFSANGSFPAGCLLGSTIVDHSNPPLSEMITFSETINVIQGDKYAIIVNYPNWLPPGAGHGFAMWESTAGNPYLGGESIFAKYSLNGPFNISYDIDSHFRASFSSVPIPSTLHLFCSGLLGVGFWFRGRITHH